MQRRLALAVLALVACQSRPKASAPATALPFASTASASPALASVPAEAHDAGERHASPKGEHVILKASADDGTSSALEVDRQGGFFFERHGSDAGKPPGCSDALATDATSALWKAIDGAAFAPTGGGFAKPVPGTKVKYSVVRMVADLSMVPSDEAAARALAPAVRAAIGAAEKCGSR